MRAGSNLKTQFSDERRASKGRLPRNETKKQKPKIDIGTHQPVITPKSDQLQFFLNYNQIETKMTYPLTAQWVWLR